MVECSKLVPGFAVGGLFAGWASRTIAANVTAIVAAPARHTATNCGRTIDSTHPPIGSSCTAILHYSCTNVACCNHAAATVICHDFNYLNCVNYSASNYATVYHTSSHCSPIARCSSICVECWCIGQWAVEAQM